MGDWDKAVSIAKAGGTVISALGAQKAGKSQARALAEEGLQYQELANFKAAQLEQNAGQEIAVGQRRAEEATRQAKLLQSKALAIAAASGGGTLDPNVLNIIGGIASEGELAAGTERYNAEETARGMRDTAKAARYEGYLAAKGGREAAKRVKSAGNWNTLSTVLSGASSFKDAFSGWGSSKA